MVPPRPTRRRRRTSEPVRLLVALGLAVLWHAVLLGGVVLHGRLFPVQPPKPRQEVAMRPLSAEDWARNRGVAPTADESSRQPTARKDDRAKPDGEEEGRGLHHPAGTGGRRPSGQQSGPRRVREDLRRGDQQPRGGADHRARSLHQVEERPAPHHGLGEPHRRRRRRGPGARRSAATGARPTTSARRPRAASASRKLEVPDISPRQEIAMRPTPEKPGDAGPKVKNQRESEAVRGNSDRLDIQDGSRTAVGQRPPLRGPPRRAGHRQPPALQRGDGSDHRCRALRPQGRRPARGRRHLPQHPGVEVRRLLQPREAGRELELGSGARR